MTAKSSPWKSGLAVLIFLAVTMFNTAMAQCSEAENATMRKYADLTRNSANAQGCAACASLANLFCIAEKGLYKDDRAAVEKAIRDTKETIKLMGDPICCPELLTKSASFGQPKTGAEAANNAAPQSKTAQDIQDLENQLNAGMNTLDNLNALNSSAEELQKDLEKVEGLMKANTVLFNREYQSEAEINTEYNQKLANLNKLAALHLELKTNLHRLEYAAAGELLNNSDTAGLGLLAGVGAMSSTHKKESIAHSDRAKAKLQNSKSEKLFQYRYKDHDFQVDLIENEMQKYFSKTYPADYSNLLNHTLVAGYEAGMKYEAFKKLFPKSKIRETGIGSYRMENAKSDSDFHFRMDRKGLKFRLMELEEIQSYSAPFSPEKLKEYQQKIVDEIKLYDDLFNLKPETYTSSNNEASAYHEIFKSMDIQELLEQNKKTNPQLTEQNILNAMQHLEAQDAAANSNPVNSFTTVTWSDKTTKAFSLIASLKVARETLTLTIKKKDRNLQPADFD